MNAGQPVFNWGSAVAPTLNLLLDTHALVWALSAARKLPIDARYLDALAHVDDQRSPFDMVIDI